jgi:hypothetical protein
MELAAVGTVVDVVAVGGTGAGVVTGTGVMASITGSPAAANNAVK